MNGRAIVGAALLLAPLAAGCVRADAAPPAPFEHGVFQYVRIFLPEETRESYSWITSAGDIEALGIVGFWEKLDMPDTPTGDPSDRIRILDQLAARGWELVNGTDTGFTLATGTAVAHRYVLRRRRR